MSRIVQIIKTNFTPGGGRDSLILALMDDGTVRAAILKYADLQGPTLQWIGLTETNR